LRLRLLGLAVAGPLDLDNDGMMEQAADAKTVPGNPAP